MLLNPLMLDSKYFHNIIQPDLNMFNWLYLKSLEEFKLQPTYKDLVKLYYFFKKSKLKYRLSIDDFNL